MDASLGVREGAAEGDGCIFFGKRGTVGGIDELEIATASVGEAPADFEAVFHPRVRIKQAADHAPIGPLGVLGDGHGVALGGIKRASVEGVNSIEAALGNRLNEGAG